MTSNCIKALIEDLQNYKGHADLQKAVRERLDLSMETYSESLNKSVESLLTKNSLTILRKLNTLDKELEKEKQKK